MQGKEDWAGHPSYVWRDKSWSLFPRRESVVIRSSHGFGGKFSSRDWFLVSKKNDVYSKHWRLFVSKSSNRQIFAYSDFGKIHGFSMSGQYDNNCASSSSCLNSSFQDTEDDKIIARILSEENGKEDRTLGKRLSHLDSIPHTPRINGEIPNVNDATLDHDRLLERLTTYGLAEFQVEGDGNCQFRALADQLFRNPEYHEHVRKRIVKQLKCCQTLYEGYVPMKYKAYLKKMKRSGEWGDHLTLQAAADWFGAKICLLTSFRDTCCIEILPKDQNPSRELWLSFWSEVHYNSLYGVGDVPTRGNRRKHWIFQRIFAIKDYYHHK